MVSALEGLTLYWLVTMMKSRRILELGGFSGYSTLWMAEALKRNLRGVPDHPVISCELDPHYVQSIRAKATEFNMDPYVKVIEGPAMDSLKTKIEPGTQFDFIFIDANKDDYINYYNYIIDSGMLSSDGLIAVDNTLFSAQTFRKYPPVQQALERLPGTLPEVDKSGKCRVSTGSADHIYAFNKVVAEDPRTEQIMLPMFDGLTLVRLRQQ
ncbi:S-adenosyl-L-methionine-dependent methyltransferase [Dimargaris cristalligena]|uniref:S-adenosyl-L-methionine-dependent methyltransferase n=1 Tax=Dimargaris cristalligena TaxID=215637 RepID=A0A4P9ZUH2_9FUNG|nr:S-adenosyl-L-methionine-dependent methyltransferase [Dimargaris cristalligena]|eukprot:RKP37195.1 S-adenosyl-L-methionine-dependent methyltransferase [Dimargaris cristalligena]